MPCCRKVVCTPPRRPVRCEEAEKIARLILNRKIKDRKIKLIPCSCLAAKNNVKKFRTTLDARNNDYSYIQHLINLCHSKSIVDNKPPRLVLDNILKSKKMEEDMRRMKEIMKENKELLKKINFIQRTKGVIDSYNKMGGVRKSNLRARVKAIKEYETDNYRMFFRILQVKPEIRALKLESSFRQNVLYMQNKCNYPIAIPGLADMMKTGSQDSINLPLRPRVYIEFCIAECIPLGKVFCTIYSDLVPIAADQFLTLLTNHKKNRAGHCKSYRTYKCSPITKIYVNSHAEFGNLPEIEENYEGAIPLDDPKRFHDDAGIISMAIENNSVSTKFIITFAKQPCLDRTHLVIGKVVSGLHVLKKLEDCGTHFGKPKEKVFISYGDYSKYSPTACK